jgi:hypothetical protein
MEKVCNNIFYISFIINHLNLADFLKARHYLYSLFDTAVTNNPNDHVNILAFNRLDDTNLTVVAIDGAKEGMRFSFVLWPGVTPDETAHLTVFFGNESAIPDTPTAAIPAINNILWFNSQTKSTPQWGTPFSGDACVDIPGGKLCDLSVGYLAPVFDNNGKLVVATEMIIRNTVFTYQLEKFSERIPGSLAYMVDITSGLMMACGKSTILVVDPDVYPIRVLTPTEVTNPIVQHSINHIQKVYGKNYEKLGNGAGQSNRIQLMYTENGESNYVSASVLQKDNGLNALIVYVIPRETLIGKYIGIVSAALAISAVIGVVGAIVGIVISILVSLPLAKLVKQMMYLENMQLNEVKDYPVSMLSEIATMQATFYIVVSRLKEYKAYLPSYVLARDFGEESDEVTEDDKLKDPTASVMESVHSSGRRSSSSISEISNKFDRKFQLGITLSKATIMTVKISLDMEKFPSSDIVSQHGTMLKAVEMISGRNQAIMIRFDQESFVLFWHESSKSNKLAVQCAFQIRENFNKMQQHIVQNYRDTETNGVPRMSIAIGIDNNDNYSGNIGTKAKRQFVAFGNCTTGSNQITDMNREWNTDLLVSDSVLNDSVQEGYVTRPLGLFDLNGEETLVHQITFRKHIHNDEWMYEMDQQKKLSIYTEYLSGYHAMESTDFTLALQHLEKQLINTPDDIPTVKLIDACKQSNITRVVYKLNNGFELVQTK